MSRCFPFPPPGYNKEIPTVQLDILKKEKHREKKHKKEKKDKDRKDRDKRDKKEKRRDKKKEKEKGKDKHLNNPNTSLPGHSGQNVFQKDSDMCTRPDNRIVSGRNAGYNEGYHSHYSSLAEEPNGAKFVHSAERGIRDDAERGGGNIMREKIIPTPDRRNERVGKLYHNSHLGNNFEDSTLELDRRLKNEAEQPYDQTRTTDNPIGGNQKRDARYFKSVPLPFMEKGDKKMVGSNGRYIGDISAEVALVPYTSGLGQGNHDRVPRESLDSDVVKKIEGQERINNLEDQRGKKQKDKERNGDMKSHEKHKSKDKEKMEEKSNSRVDRKSEKQVTRESRKMDILTPPIKEMLPDGEYNSSSMSSRVKMNQANGFLTNKVIPHVTGPSVLSSPSSLQDQSVRAPERILVKPSSGGPGLSKTDKAGKLNGTIHPSTEQVVKARPRSPHPDARRLADILAIPKIEELSEVDDSDWLISSKLGPEKKRKVDDSRGTTIADTPPRVWSKAKSIDSADVCALPYVIPY